MAVASKRKAAPAPEPAPPKDKSRKKPTEPEKPVALLEGGPRDGWGYFTDDLRESVRVGERTGRPFPYRATRRRTTHPDGYQCGVWEWVEPERPAGEPVAAPAPLKAEPRPLADVDGPVPAYACDECGEPTFRVSRRGELLILDVDLRRVGMYVVEAGRPIWRRSISDLYAANRDHVEAPGYEPHECTVTPSWTQR